MSRWAEALPLLQDSAEYAALASQPAGSTPQELWADFAEDELRANPFATPTAAHADAHGSGGRGRRGREGEGERKGARGEEREGREEKRGAREDEREKGGSGKRERERSSSAGRAAPRPSKSVRQ